MRSWPGARPAGRGSERGVGLHRGAQRSAPMSRDEGPTFLARRSAGMVMKALGGRILVRSQ